jgi:hypothetical protein
MGNEATNIVLDGTPRLTKVNNVNYSIPSMSSNINEIATALTKAQVKLNSITKNEKGFGYNYASLASTIESTKEALAEFDLAITQLVGTTEDNLPQITTVLMHSSGQFISSVAHLPLVEMKGVNEAQRAGAVYSYLRRYALQAILNIASEDNDASSKGNHVSTNTTASSTNKPRKFRASDAKKAQEKGDDELI